MASNAEGFISIIYSYIHYLQPIRSICKLRGYYSIEENKNVLWSKPT